jgi:hypothetical protein
MKTLSDLQSELSTIATNLGFGGVFIDSIVNLLAEAVYRNEITSINTLLEYSSSRCILTNSAIQHACDLGYSVPRGRCQHLYIDNLIPVTDMVVDQYDDAGSVNNYHLYYAHPYTFVSNELQESVEFNVAKNVNTLQEQADIKHLYIDFIPESGQISQDYELRKEIANSNDSNWADLEKCKVFEYMTDYINSNVTAYFIQTIVGYAVRMFPKIWSGSTPILGFTNDQSASYYLRYVDYTDDTDFNQSDLTDIKGFITEEDTPEVYKVERSFGAVSDPEQIHYFSISSFKGNQVIKSNSDVVDLIKEYFYGIVADLKVVIKMDSETEVMYPNGAIFVYYLMASGGVLPETKIDQFKQQIKTAYYINQDIIFSEAIAHTLTSPYYIKVQYYSQYSLSIGDIQTIVNQDKLHIGGTFNPYQLLSDIKTAYSEQIKTIEFTSADGLEPANDLEYVTLADNEYVDIPAQIQLVKVNS